VLETLGLSTNGRLALAKCLVPVLARPLLVLEIAQKCVIFDPASSPHIDTPPAITAVPRRPATAAPVARRRRRRLLATVEEEEEEHVADDESEGKKEEVRKEKRTRRRAAFAYSARHDASKSSSDDTFLGFSAMAASAATTSLFACFFFICKFWRMASSLLSERDLISKSLNDCDSPTPAAPTADRQRAVAVSRQRSGANATQKTNTVASECGNEKRRQQKGNNSGAVPSGDRPVQRARPSLAAAPDADLASPAHRAA
jgi:hypothetical protein